MSWLQDIGMVILRRERGDEHSGALFMRQGTEKQDGRKAGLSVICYWLMGKVRVRSQKSGYFGEAAGGGAARSF